MERLKALRKQRKLTQKQMADFLKIERTTYVKYENAQSEPTFSTLKRLAHFFGVTIDYLLCNELQAQNSLQLSPDEHSLIELYRALATPFKEEVKDFVQYQLSKREKTNLSGSTNCDNEIA